MLKKTSMRIPTSLALGAAVAGALAVSTPVAAQERKSPLADAPAIRRRVELRDKRFEIGVRMSSTLGQDFYHAVMVSGRIGFHLTDWLALAAVGGLNVTPKFKTSFNERLMEVLPDKKGTDRTPTKDEALAGMNRIGEVFGGQVELIPFTGKFSLFSKLFMNYDFYAFGGPGVINFKSDTPCTGTESASCAVTGMKIGANFGVGAHLFANDFFALNFEVRDILVRNNPAGRDEDGDMVANDRDLSWDSNIILGLNLMFFLPARPPVSP
jgi:outer membrane beta-barrel protein